MEPRLYIRNLAPSINNSVLEDLFNAIGNVESTELEAASPETGLKVAYVNMQTVEAAQDCIDRLNGCEHAGYRMLVTWDRPHQPDPLFKKRKGNK